MNIALFSVIEWSYLDQRPQMMAKKLAEHGYNVYYFEPFYKLNVWSDDCEHPWEEYEKLCWKEVNVSKNLTTVTLFNLPAHRSIENILKYNEIYLKKNMEFIKSLKINLAIVVDPFFGEHLKELNIDFIYDHVDDTHEMGHVIKDLFYKKQEFCMKNSIKNINIQPSIANRNNDLYIPNGIEPEQLTVSDNVEKFFDAGCISSIDSWFDIKSVFNSKKKILLIGPMNDKCKEKYFNYIKEGKRNVFWIPKVSRKTAAQWMLRCKCGLVPFNDEDPLVDYVMPIKIVEYLYLGLPSVSYLNKGIEEEFSDVTEFYSCINWKGLPNLDTAIDNVLLYKYSEVEYRKKALEFTWNKLFNKLFKYIDSLEIQS